MSFYVHPSPSRAHSEVIRHKHRRRQHATLQQAQRETPKPSSNILKFDDDDTIYDADKMDRVDILLLLIDSDPNLPKDLKDHMKKYRKHGRSDKAAAGSSSGGVGDEGEVVANENATGDGDALPPTPRAAKAGGDVVPPETEPDEMNEVSPEGPAVDRSIDVPPKSTVAIRPGALVEKEPAERVAMDGIQSEEVQREEVLPEEVQPEMVLPTTATAPAPVRPAAAPQTTPRRCKYDPECPAAHVFCYSRCPCDLCDYWRRAETDALTYSNNFRKLHPDPPTITAVDQVNWKFHVNCCFRGNIQIRNHFIHGRHYNKIQDDLAAEMIKQMNQMQREAQRVRMQFYKDGDTTKVKESLKKWVMCGCVTLKEHRRKCQKVSGERLPSQSNTIAAAVAETQQEPTVLVIKAPAAPAAPEDQAERNASVAAKAPVSHSDEATVDCPSASTATASKTLNSDDAKGTRTKKQSKKTTKFPSIYRASRRKAGFTMADLEYENEQARFDNERRKQGWVPPPPKPRGLMGSTRKASREEQPAPAKVTKETEKTGSPVRSVKFTSINKPTAANTGDAKTRDAKDSPRDVIDSDEDEVVVLQPEPVSTASSGPHVQVEEDDDCTLISESISENNTVSSPILKEEDSEEEFTFLSILRRRRGEEMDSWNVEAGEGKYIAGSRTSTKEDHYSKEELDKMLGDEMLIEFTNDII